MSRSSINIWSSGRKCISWRLAQERRRRERGGTEKNNKRVNENKRGGTRGAERKYNDRGFIYNVAETSQQVKYNLAFLMHRCYGFCSNLHIYSFFTEMANTAAALMALLLLLCGSMPCFSVYNSGECFFNTKGTMCSVCAYVSNVKM